MRETMLGMAAMCRWLTHPYRVAKGLSGRLCAHEVHSHSWQATDLESTTTMLLQATEFTTKKPGLCSYVEVRRRPPMTSDTFSASGLQHSHFGTCLCVRRFM